MNKRLARLLWGAVAFGKREEYLQFQFRLLYASLLMAVFFSATFVLADWLGFSYLPHAQVTAIKIYFVTSLLQAIFLRGRKHLFLAMAWLFATTSFLIFLSGLLLVPNDELRILWFYINLPVVYILLGQMAGFAETVLSLACIVIVNPYLKIPYSTNALMTVILSLGCTSIFFYIYTSRSVSFFRRMTESNRLLHVLATRDPLTGIMNSRAYYEACDRLIRLASRTNAAYSVMFLDLDHFKSINDKYGHEAGDEVLKEVANCLARYTRKSDVLGRIGGEEFSKFLPNTELPVAMLLAEKLRGEIEQIMPAMGGNRILVTASIGVASNQRRYQSITTIQSEADQAMYLAKRQGRNCVVSFNTPDIFPAEKQGLSQP